MTTPCPACEEARDQAVAAGRAWLVGAPHSDTIDKITNHPTPRE